MKGTGNKGGKGPSLCHYAPPPACDAAKSCNGGGIRTPKSVKCRSHANRLSYLPSKPTPRIIELFRKKQLSTGISEETASRIPSFGIVRRSLKAGVEEPIFPGASCPVVALASNFGSLFQQSGRLSAWNFERSAESKQDRTR